MKCVWLESTFIEQSKWIRLVERRWEESSHRWESHANMHRTQEAQQRWRPTQRASSTKRQQIDSVYPCWLPFPLEFQWITSSDDPTIISLRQTEKCLRSSVCLWLLEKARKHWSNNERKKTHRREEEEGEKANSGGFAATTDNNSEETKSPSVKPKFVLLGLIDSMAEHSTVAHYRLVLVLLRADKATENKQMRIARDIPIIRTCNTWYDRKQGYNPSAGSIIADMRCNWSKEWHGEEVVFNHTCKRRGSSDVPISADVIDLATLLVEENHRGNRVWLFYEDHLVQPNKQENTKCYFFILRRTCVLMHNR